MICKFVKKFFIVLFVLTGSISGFAQQKLTLEAAILQQYRNLYPEHFMGLSWIPQSSWYSYYLNSDTILLANAAEDAEEVLTVAMLNKALKQKGEEELKRLPGVEFISRKELVFNNGSNYYHYNISSGKVDKILSCDDSGLNISYQPETHRLAYTLDNNLYYADSTRSKVAITSFEDPNIVAGQAIARNEFGIDKGIFWSPSGRQLAFYQKDETNVKNYPIINYTVTPAVAKNIKYPMAGGGSEQAKVGVYDFSTGKTIYLQTTGEADQYLTNLAWGPDENLIYVAVLNRGQDHLKLNTYEAATGRFVKTLFEETADKYVEPESPPLFFEQLPGKFLWMSDRNGYHSIYLYNTDGKLIKQLTKDSDVQEVIGVDAKGKELIYTAVEGLIDVQLFSVNLRSGKISVLDPKEGVHRAQMNDEGTFILDSYSSVKEPHVLQLLSSGGTLVQTLINAADPLSDYNIGEISLPVITAEDGTKLQGRLIKPFDFDSTQTYPVVVYVYGGPHAQLINNSYLASASLWMFYLANQGYLVFTLDGRGSANRGSEFEQTVFRNLGEVEMQDQLAGVDYLKSLPYVDDSKMAVHGWSFGGFMTVSLMLRHPGVFQVGVAGGPVTDWNMYEVMYTERYMDTPEENPEGYKTAALAQYADNLKGDLLLIHGLDDDVVLLQHNITLLNALIKAGKDVDFFNYPGHKHNVLGRDRVHLYNKVIEYIKEKMPPLE